MVVNPIVSGGTDKKYSITFYPTHLQLPSSASAGEFIHFEYRDPWGSMEFVTDSGQDVPLATPSRFNWYFVMPAENVTLDIR